MIALDMMGGDHAPSATLEGAVIAASEGIPVLLVGDRTALSRAQQQRASAAGLEIIQAGHAVPMVAKGASFARGEDRTSLRVSTELVKSGQAAAMVSMGSTGAIMTTALRVLGRLPGVERPALAVLLPGGSAGTLFLDAGANADARPSHLVQFAILGAAFMRSARGVEHPRTGLLSNGEEANKGSKAVVEAHQLLRETQSLSFIGNIESQDLLAGKCDVLVTDGFTGNVAVKLLEGVITHLFSRLGPLPAPDALEGVEWPPPPLRAFRDQLSARHHGAAPLLGVNGAVFIGHGNSDAETVATALRAAHVAVEGDIMTAFTHGLRLSE